MLSHATQACDGHRAHRGSLLPYAAGERRRGSAYSIGVQRDVPNLPPWQPVCDAADAAFAVLVQRVARLGNADLLGEFTVTEATLQFHALCEGLATLELRGVRIAFDAERIWRAAMTSLIAGFTARQPSGVHGHVGSGQHQRLAVRHAEDGHAQTRPR